MIVDVISSDLAGTGVMDFTADGGVLEVAVNGPGVEGLSFHNAAGNEWFSVGDNMNVLGMVVNIPYGFGQGSGEVIVGPRWGFDGGGLSLIPEFGGDRNDSSRIFVPNACDGLDFPDKLYLAAPTGTGLFRMMLLNFQMNVSMVNLPTILDGETIKVQVSMIIEHSKPMVPFS
jgi:hypothetical protein